MEARPVSFPPGTLLELQKTPFYTVRFIDRNPDGIALMVRVENLKEFEKNAQPAASNLIRWCSPEGTWVIALGYALKPRNGRGSVSAIVNRIAAPYPQALSPSSHVTDLGEECSAERPLPDMPFFSTSKGCTHCRANARPPISL